MTAWDEAFFRRLGLLLGLTALAVGGCVAVAIVVARHADGTIARITGVELESARLARQFRVLVDDLHGALLRSGTAPVETNAGQIRQNRERLAQWVADRFPAARSEAEREVLRHLASELAEYSRQLDRINESNIVPGLPLDPRMLVELDDAAVRLQHLADDFDAIHDANASRLVESSLMSVARLRNLVFACLGLLLATTTILATLLYRDVVRPLRARLVEREALLTQREKLAALGTLAAGVAHEIRNPLTAIKARLYTLRRAVPTPDAAEDIRAITGEIDRLEGIVRDVLGYARPADPKFATIDLAAWLREFGAFVDPELAGRGTMLTIEAPEPLNAQADAAQLRQIMLNLVRNAVEAQGGRPGRIELAVRRERVPVGRHTEELAVLSVGDDGPGIPPAVQARLFDPFFTTKAAGTGLGLAIVARLVEAHGGTIVLQTAPGKGTCFRVRLPLVRKTA